MRKHLVPVLAALLLAPFPALAQTAPAERYVEVCAPCHGADRLGAIGPALLPENLGRMTAKTAAQVIAEGRPATQMQGFKDKLSPEEIAGLAAYVMTPPAEPPRWSDADMAASRVVHTAPEALVSHPVHTADPLNLFTVVEAGDHHVTILDGDRFEPLARFPSRFALHGGVKYSPDGRLAYFVSRDGWVSIYDLWGLVPVAEIRAGINTRNIAVSEDGRFVAVANTLPGTLVLLDARDLTPIRTFQIATAAGPSRASAVYTAAPRKSFILALKDAPEIWEIATSDSAQPIYPGHVHTYEAGMVEAVGVQRGLFAVRRMVIEEPLDDFFFDPAYANLIGATRDGQRARVVNLDVGRVIGELALPGMPHLGSGISWLSNGRHVIATPHLKEAAISVIDAKTWKTLTRITTPGPGFFLRSHDATPYAWTDSSLGQRRDTLSLIDKNTLEIAATVTPEPGKTASHVEFTRDGRFALVSVWEDPGWLVVYDATTLKEVKRLAMRKPVGKYNVFNKISRSDGTSH